MTDPGLKLAIGVMIGFCGSMMAVSGMAGLAVSFLMSVMPGFRLLCGVQIPVGLGIALVGGMMIRQARRK